MLGQDEDPDCRPVLGTDRLGRAETLVGVRRRHADVDDRHVREMFPGGPQQGVRVDDLGNDLETGVRQQPRDAFTNEQRVVGEDEPQGHGGSTNPRMAAPEIRSLGMKPKD